MENTLQLNDFPISQKVQETLERILRKASVSCKIIISRYSGSPEIIFEDGEEIDLLSSWGSYSPEIKKKLKKVAIEIFILREIWQPLEVVGPPITFGTIIPFFTHSLH